MGGIEQNNESLQQVKKLAEVARETFANFDATSPEFIKAELETQESHQEFAKRMKETVLNARSIDRSNYFETILIQRIAKIEGHYDGKVDGSWGDNTQNAFLETFSESQRSGLQVTGEGLLKKTYIDGKKHTVLENKQEQVDTGESIAKMLTSQLDNAGISREYINQISQNATSLLEAFPSLELHLNNNDLESALKYLRENSGYLDHSHTDIKAILEATIQALEFADIVSNPEKLQAMQTRQKVEIVLDSFEIINSDDSVTCLENEKELYSNFVEQILNAIGDKALNSDEVIATVREVSQKFEGEIHSWVHTQNPVGEGDPRYDVHYRDAMMRNDHHIARIKERFSNFTRVLDSMEGESGTREELYSKAIQGFIDFSTDNPLSNPDIRFKRSTLFSSLKSKLTNTFEGEYKQELLDVLEKQNIDIEAKVKENKKEIQEQISNIIDEELEVRARILTQLQLEQEFEYDIFTALEAKLESGAITGDKKVLIKQYKELFDPTNETFNLSVNAKNALLEEVIALPLTAFVIGRISKAVWGANQATLLWSLGVDFAEGTAFELITQARQSRGSFEDYTLKDFAVGSLVGASLFGAMKYTPGITTKIGIDSSKLSGRTMNHGIEGAIFTGIEGTSRALAYDENIFENAQAPEKVLSNLGILFLVKLGYNPKELGGIKASAESGSSAVRAKAKMKGVAGSKAEGGNGLHIKDALGGNIEHVMKGFGDLNSRIDSQFQTLITRNNDISSVKQEAEGLIKKEIIHRLAELEALGVKVQTKEEQQYVRDYMLQRIAEFNKLIEIRQSGNKIPEEMDMNLGKMNWELRLEKPDDIREYFDTMIKNLKRGHNTPKYQ